MKLTIESTGHRDVKLIMRGEEVIGMAERYTSGYWAPHCPDTDRKLASASFISPTAVKNWFETRAPTEGRRP